MIYTHSKLLNTKGDKKEKKRRYGWPTLEGQVACKTTISKRTQVNLQKQTNNTGYTKWGLQ